MVERCLAKANVASSNLVFRSIPKGKQKRENANTKKERLRRVRKIVAFLKITSKVLFFMVPSPSGKAKVCKTFIPRFKSGWYLQTDQVWRNGRRTGLKILRGQLRVGSSPTTWTREKTALLIHFENKFQNFI